MTAASSAQGPALEALSPDARWIGRLNPDPPSEVGTQPPAPALRRSFTLGAPVRSATLTVAGFGYYEARLNGRPVSDAVLDPPPSQYDKSVFSRALDVTALLEPGENVLSFVLGRSYVSGITRPGPSWTSEPRVRAQLDVVVEGGRAERVVTDGSWRMGDSPTRDWMYFGESYDARQEVFGWDRPAFNDEAWLPAPVHEPVTGRVVPATAPPVEVVDTFDAVGVCTLPSGASVHDFGKITAGWARLHVRGTAGTTVRLKYGQQVAPDGSVVLVPPVGSSEPMTHVDTYVLSGKGDEVWEPRFSRHGFQYLQVEVDGSVQDLRVEARECHTPAPSTGAFSCASGLVNTLHENHRRSLLLNHWGFPTDTSWRDRMGWTADSALFLDSAILNFAGLRPVYEDWLLTLRDSQQPDGSVPTFAPDPGYPFYNDPSWSGMLVLIPWAIYQHFGETGVLADSFPAMVAWMDVMDATVAETGDLYTGRCLGDHAAAGSEAGGTLNLRPPEGGGLTGNAHLHQQARVLAEIAALLGDDAVRERCARLADRVLRAFTATYFDEANARYREPDYEPYRQTSNLLPLAFGMVPEDRVQAVFANLARHVEERGNRLDTGAIGTKLLLPVLTQHGRADLAYAVLTQTEYPSWGYWVTQGATTSWETWRNEGTDQTLDHPFLGSFDEWLYQHLAGIQAAEPGYRSLRIAPVLPRELEHVSATVTTPQGEVSSAWRRSGDDVTLTVGVPFGATAVLELPTGSTQVEVLEGARRRAGAERILDVVDERCVVRCRTGA